MFRKGDAFPKDIDACDDSEQHHRHSYERCDRGHMPLIQMHKNQAEDGFKDDQLAKDRNWKGCAGSVP